MRDGNSSGTSSPGAWRMRPESRSPCSRGSSTGDEFSPLCSQTRSCDGTVKGSACSGAGNHGTRVVPVFLLHIRPLIATMARANRTWGEERIAAELLLKLAISVSPRTVRRYMCRPVPSRPRSSSQTWRTFLRNHAGEILACDFFVTVTATFRLLYVFLVLDIDTRRLLHWNVTEHPTAEWTVQRFRACLTGDETVRIHHSRPRQHLFAGRRPSDILDGSARPENASARPAGERESRSWDSRAVSAGHRATIGRSPASAPTSRCC
jgi:hypothetical protein